MLSVRVFELVCVPSYNPIKHNMLSPTNMKKGIGIDIGGTDTKCIGHGENPTQFSSFASNGSIDGVITQITNLLDVNDLRAHTPNIGLAITGLVDTKKGYLVLSNNLGYNQNVPLDVVELLSSRLGLQMPIHLYNDGDAAAFAEAKLRGLRDVIMVTLGTSPGG